MGTAVVLTLLVWAAAVYATLRQRTPIYLLALIGGELGALTSMLRPALYGLVYGSVLGGGPGLFGQHIPWGVLVTASWTSILPVLLIVYFYRTEWWYPDYLTALMTYTAFLLYHLVIEAIGVQGHYWDYTTPAGLPFLLPSPLLSGLLEAAISLVALYAVLLVQRASITTMLLSVIPAVVLAAILVRGLLGAPFWVVLLIGTQGWAVIIGLVCMLVLVGWAIHLTMRGLAHIPPWHNDIAV